MNYQKIYNDIINRAKLKNRKKFKKNDADYIYYEKHHILPKCLGGSNDKENLILLTAREHYICHKLLTYIYSKNKKIECAFYYMTFNKRYDKYVSSKDYAYAKELRANIPMLEETKNKIGESNKGKKRTLVARKIMSERQKERNIPAHYNEISLEQKIVIIYMHLAFNIGISKISKKLNISHNSIKNFLKKNKIYKGKLYPKKIKEKKKKEKRLSSLKGKKQKPETIQKRINKLTGQKRSLEQCENIRKSLKGKKLTPEHLKHLKGSHIGNPSPNKGKHFIIDENGIKKINNN
jgi:hypothetical protein